MAFVLSINGLVHQVDEDGRTPLLWVLRDTLGLTGTKYGCGAAQCGACTVHLSGEPVRSCTLLLDAVGEAPIVTVEAIGGRQANALRDAWIAQDVPQCGFCQSGQMMSALALLRTVPVPSDEQIDAAMSGNICRCATYNRIRAAIHAAAKASGSGDL